MNYCSAFFVHLARTLLSLFFELSTTNLCMFRLNIGLNSKWNPCAYWDVNGSFGRSFIIHFDASTNKCQSLKERYVQKMVSRRRFVCSAEHFWHVPIPQSSTIFENNIPTIIVHLIINRQCLQVSFSSKWNSWNGWRNDLTSFNAKHVVFFIKLKATNKPLMFWIPHIRNDVWKTQNQNKKYH